jgi:hypothetical protein
MHHDHIRQWQINQILDGQVVTREQPKRDRPDHLQTRTKEKLHGATSYTGRQMEERLIKDRDI